MKQLTYHLDTDLIKANCLKEIALLPIGANKLVVIKDKRKVRSEAQHRLKWVWMNCLAKERVGFEGWDSEGWNWRFKARFIKPLLLEQDEEYAAYFYRFNAMCEAVADNPVLLKSYREDFWGEVIKTEWLHVKGMSELMTMIDRYCLTEFGLRLPVPDELKYAYEEAA